MKRVHQGAAVSIGIALLFFAALTGAAKGAITYESKWGGYGLASGQFIAPNGVAIGPSGNVIVADGGSRIQEFSSSGAFIRKWAVSNENSLAVDTDDNIYAADYPNSVVRKFGPDGSLLTTWGSEGTANGQFDHPTGIAVAPDRKVLVLDGGNNRVQIFTQSGTFQTSWGGAGDGNGQFASPRGIAVDSTGNVFVADTSNQRIQKLDSSGQFLKAWGTQGTGPGQFNNPYGVATGPLGRIFVLDRMNQRVQEFTSNGDFVSSAGSYGTQNGNLVYPLGLAADSAGHVFVTDTDNHRVQRYLVTPETTIDSAPGSLVNHATVNFQFSSSTPGVTFQCRIDAGAYQACGSSSAFGPISDGTHQIEVRALDSLGNLDSTPAESSFQVDTTPPTEFSVNQPGGPVSRNPTLSWTGSSDSGSGFDRYEIWIDGNKIGETDQTAFQVNSNLANGTHSIQVIAKDLAGNARTSPTGQFEVDATSPEPFSLLAPAGDAVKEVQPVFSWEGTTDTGSGLAAYEIWIDGTKRGEVSASTTSFSIPGFLFAGSHNWFVEAVDNAGNRRRSETRDFVIQQREVGVTINNGAQYTNDPDVTVNLVAPIGTTQTLISNDGGFLQPSTFGVVETIPWRLDSSGPERLPKTVYVRFRGESIADQTLTDDIILDETSPVVHSASAESLAAGASSSFRNLRVRSPKAKVILIRTRATDKTSGVASIQAGTKKSPKLRKLPYKNTLRIRANTKFVWLRVWDRAGNPSRWLKIRVAKRKPRHE